MRREGEGKGRGWDRERVEEEWWKEGGEIIKVTGWKFKVNYI